MGRTQIYLGSDELALLDRAARESGASRSELIRRAVHATFADTSITIRAFFGELDGDRAIRVTRSGRDADAIIDDVYRELVEKGAMDLVVQR